MTTSHNQLIRRLCHNAEVWTVSVCSKLSLASLTREREREREQPVFPYIPPGPKK